MNEVLELLHVSATAAGCRLHNINLHIFADMTHIILSDNDQQCAVLNSILRGELGCDSGQIFVNGLPVPGFSADRAQQEGIYTVFSQSHLFLRNTVAENLFVIGRRRISVKPIRYKELNRATNRFLEEFHLLQTFKASETLYQYTKVQCHILEILRAVAQGARLILCENIFEDTTAAETEILLRLISDVRRRGIAFLLFLTRYNPVVGISDMTTILRNGTTVYNLRRNEFSEETVKIALSGGRFERDLEHAHRLVNRERILGLEDIRNDWTLNGLSFDLYSGEILGLLDVGMNVCDDLTDVLCRGGFCSGRIFYANSVFEIDRRQRFPSNTISYIAENKPGCDLFRSMNLYDNITLTIPRKLQHPLENIHGRVRRYMFHSALHKLEADSLTNEIERKSPLYAVPVNSRIKILFARCLCAQTKVILIEDTHTNRSPEYEAILHRLMLCVKREGISVLIISNDLPFLRINCDRILYLENGVVSGSIEAFSNDDLFSGSLKNLK